MLPARFLNRRQHQVKWRRPSDCTILPGIECRRFTRFCDLWMSQDNLSQTLCIERLVVIVIVHLLDPKAVVVQQPL